MSEQQRVVLERLAEVAVPADECPSAADVGAVTFVERVLTVDRPDWLERVERLFQAGGVSTVSSS